MSFSVMLTDEAVQDIEELYDYIVRHDDVEKADYVLGKLEQLIVLLDENPERGVYPNELRLLGIREYREVFFKPYRIIYRILNQTVYVLLITDDRRDMQALLQRRILNA